MRGIMGMLLVVALLVVIGCEKKVPTETSTPGENAPVVVASGQKICHVMGKPINKNIYVDYKGRRIYLCCTMCVGKFKADPEKYLAKVDAELKGAAKAVPAESDHTGHDH